MVRNLDRRDFLKLAIPAAGGISGAAIGHKIVKPMMDESFNRELANYKNRKTELVQAKEALTSTDPKLTKQDREQRLVEYEKAKEEAKGLTPPSRLAKNLDIAVYDTSMGIGGTIATASIRNDIVKKLNQTDNDSKYQTAASCFGFDDYDKAIDERAGTWLVLDANPDIEIRANAILEHTQDQEIKLGDEVHISNFAAKQLDNLYKLNRFDYETPNSIRYLLDFSSLDFNNPRKTSFLVKEVHNNQAAVTSA